MTDRVIIHSFHKLLFTATSSESHLGGAGVTGDGQLMGKVDFFGPQVAGGLAKGPLSSLQLHFKFKGTGSEKQ